MIELINREDIVQKSQIQLRENSKQSKGKQIPQVQTSSKMSTIICESPQPNSLRECQRVLCEESLKVRKSVLSECWRLQRQNMRHCNAMRFERTSSVWSLQRRGTYAQCSLMEPSILWRRGIPSMCQHEFLLLH